MACITVLLSLYVKTAAAIYCDERQYLDYIWGREICVDCPVGYGSDGMLNPGPCYECNNGRFQTSDYTRWPSGCGTCGRGTFSNSVIRTYCPSCGTMVSGVGATGCSDCSAGYQLRQFTDTWPYEGQTYYDCVQCDAGYYCPDGNTKTQCPVGTYSAAGASTLSGCRDCDAGKWWNILPVEELNQKGLSYATAVVSCWRCVVGSYCPGGSIIIKCAAGKTAGAGSRTASNCVPCLAGYYNNISGAICIVCPAGKYSGSGATTCTNCDEGKYTSTTGRGICETCGAGTYWVKPPKPPGPPNGYSVNTDGQQICWPCPAGWKCAAGVATMCLAG
jgi:hypothetical protein